MSSTTMLLTQQKKLRHYKGRKLQQTGLHQLTVQLLNLL